MNCSNEEMYFSPADYTELLPETESYDMEFFMYLDVEAE